MRQMLPFRVLLVFNVISITSLKKLRCAYDVYDKVRDGKHHLDKVVEIKSVSKSLR